jgi:hypothetical protein
MARSFLLYADDPYVGRFASHVRLGKVLCSSGIHPDRLSFSVPWEGSKREAQGAQGVTQPDAQVNAYARNKLLRRA